MLALRRPMIPEPGIWREDRADWSCEDDYAMEQEVQEFLWGLVRAIKPDLVFEVGSWKGSTAEVIGNALLDNGRGRLLSAEVNPRVVGIAQARCAHLPCVEIRHAPARSLIPGLQNVGLLISDGDLAQRDGDEREFQSVLAPGAIIVRHDVGAESWPGVITLLTPRGVALSQYRPES